MAMRMAQLIDEASQLFGVTPFGFFCYVCKAKVDATFMAVYLHVKRKHPDFCDWSKLNAKVVNEALEKRKKAVTNCGIPHDFTLEPSWAYICACGRYFSRLCHLKRHAQKTGCDSTKSQAELAYRTICHRLVPRSSLPNLVIMRGVHGDDPPLLVPNCFLINPKDTTKPTWPDSWRQVKCPIRAKKIYSDHSEMDASKRRHRRFVLGALYSQIFPGCKMIDLSGQRQGSMVDLNLTVGKIVSTVTIASAVDQNDLLDSIVELGQLLPEKGNCRAKVCDEGTMHALGYRSPSLSLLYKPTLLPGMWEAVKRMGHHFSDWAKKVFPVVSEGIELAESCKSHTRLEDCLGTCVMISRDLGNASHYDNADDSKSIAIWVEEVPGQASNWHFILPNASIDGSLGVAIKLFHGVSVCWDGRLIRHCTSVTALGSNNHVYGCMVGSCRK